MRGVRARFGRVASCRRLPWVGGRPVGDTDRRGRGRVVSEPVAPTFRAAAVMRVAYAALIAIAVAVLLFHEFTVAFAAKHGDPIAHRIPGGVGAPLDPGNVIWALPAVPEDGAPLVAAVIEMFPPAPAPVVRLWMEASSSCTFEAMSCTSAPASAPEFDEIIELPGLSEIVSGGPGL